MKPGFMKRTSATSLHSRQTEAGHSLSTAEAVLKTPYGLAGIVINTR